MNSQPVVSGASSSKMQHHDSLGHSLGSQGSNSLSHHNATTYLDEVEARPTSAVDPADLSDSEPEFDPTKCLFCNLSSPSTDDSLEHMRSTHGLFIPNKDQLIVEVETLVGYLHLVIFGYFECIYCGSERSSAEAAQQHMIGKSHCMIDISDETSEFRDFYDLESDGHEDGREKSSAGSAIQLDDSTLRLSSGKTLSHRSSPKPRQQRPKNKEDSQTLHPGLEPSPATSQTESDSTHNPEQSLSRADMRGIALANQVAHLRDGDRRSLMHLPASAQRAVLDTHKKQLDKARRAERSMRGRVEGLGNKTLMKHFVNDVPGRANG